MADWSTPTNASTYTSVLPTLNEKIENTAKMDYTGDTNVPTGAIRCVTADAVLEQWDGADWNTLHEGSGWSPSFTVPGSKASESIPHAKYYIVGGLVFFELYGSVTLSGSTGIVISVNLPTTGIAHNASAAFPCGSVTENGSQSTEFFWRASTTNILIGKHAAAVIANGDFVISIQGFYQKG